MSNTTRSVTSTAAKNEFGSLLDAVVAGEHIVVTRHGVAKAVLISVAEYDDLKERGRVKLEALHAEFDSLLGNMQTPAAEHAMRRAFDTSPEELGQAAIDAASQSLG